MSAIDKAGPQADNSGKKFFIDIEGREHPWDEPTITAAQIAHLGGWDLAQGVIEVDADNVEHQLAADAVVELKPGHGFAKKIKWQRGAPGHSDDSGGKKFFVNIEGQEIPWDSPTITAADIAKLGGWDLSQGVIEVDQDNVEHPVAPDAVVELKPGHGFAKKIKWQRGNSVIEDRLEAELQLIRSRFPSAIRSGYWFHLGTSKVPGAGWNREATELAIRAPQGYPGATPYGVYVPAGLRVNGAAPDNYTEPAGEAPPFPGQWGVFSWQSQDGIWRPGATPAEGSNLLNFALSTLVRLTEGK